MVFGVRDQFHSGHFFRFLFFYLELLLEKDRSNAPANTEHIEKLKVSLSIFKFVCLTKLTLFEHGVVFLFFLKEKNKFLFQYKFIVLYKVYGRPEFLTLFMYRTLLSCS
jgi:hypothetical protein